MKEIVKKLKTERRRAPLRGWADMTVGIEIFLGEGDSLLDGQQRPIYMKGAGIKNSLIIINPPKN